MHYSMVKKCFDIGVSLRLAAAALTWNYFWSETLLSDDLNFYRGDFAFFFPVLSF